MICQTFRPGNEIDDATDRLRFRVVMHEAVARIEL